MNPTDTPEFAQLPDSPKRLRALWHQYKTRPGRRSRPGNSPYANARPAPARPTALEQALAVCDDLDRNFTKQRKGRTVPWPRNRIRLLREDVKVPLRPWPLHGKNRAQRDRIQCGFFLLRNLGVTQKYALE